MAQHDMNIANQGFPATRADINNALQALATNSSGTSAPSTTFANQWWYDTTNNKLYIRNEANNAWIQVAVLDQTNNEWQITTGQISAGDSDGLVFKTDDGNTRITLSDGGDVTFADGTDVITASAGTDNVRIGEGAGDSITSGGNYNVVIGKDAGTALTTGDSNVAVGFEALATEDTGTNSVAIGYRALKTQNNDTTNYNVGIGFDAGLSITTGTQNVLIGGKTGDALTTGTDNVAIGRAALTADDVGNKTVAIGTNALAAQNYSTSTDSQNTAVGYNAGTLLTTGTENVFVGHISGAACVTGLANTYIGRNAGGATTSSYNTFIGTSSGGSITSGQGNTVVGRYSGNEGGLDIRTLDNNIVLSDGNGNHKGAYRTDWGGSWAWKSGVTGVARHNGGEAVTVANAATVQISSGELGSAHVCVYDTGSGDGGMYFASYRAATVLNNSSGAYSFNTTSGSTGYNLYKSTFSHSCFFENRTGTSRTMVIAVYGSRAR